MTVRCAAFSKALLSKRIRHDLRPTRLRPRLTEPLHCHTIPTQFLEREQPRYAPATT
jgi:hypothetical protein